MRTKDEEKKMVEIGVNRRNGAWTESRTIDSEPSRVYAGDVPVHARGVSHDRERTMTPTGVLGREKKARPMDILMSLCVCVFGMSRFIADSNRSRTDRCDGIAPRRYGNAVSGRVTALLGDDSNRGA